ncbi:hypothetical protein NXW24_20815 [Bacteroides fragilis]|nr:hypothetical protein [Bacteroides fragilis]
MEATLKKEIGYFRMAAKPDLYPNTDWNDLVLDKNVLTSQHSLDFSGGNRIKNTLFLL